MIVQLATNKIGRLGANDSHDTNTEERYRLLNDTELHAYGKAKTEMDTEEKLQATRDGSASNPSMG